MLCHFKNIYWNLHKMEMTLKLRKKPKQCHLSVSARLQQVKLQFGGTFNPQVNLDQLKNEHNHKLDATNTFIVNMFFFEFQGCSLCKSILTIGIQPSLFICSHQEKKPPPHVYYITTLIAQYYPFFTITLVCKYKPWLRTALVSSYLGGFEYEIKIYSQNIYLKKLKIIFSPKCPPQIVISKNKIMQILVFYVIIYFASKPPKQDDSMGPGCPNLLKLCTLINVRPRPFQHHSSTCCRRHLTIWNSNNITLCDYRSCLQII